MRPSASLERVRFVHGARLPAADLTAAADCALGRQRLHVVAAHRTWGIAGGLDLRVAPEGALVRPGIAFDVYGRPLALGAPAVALLTPALAAAGAPVALVLTWAEPVPAVELAPTAAVRPGLDVVLAEFELSGGELGDPDLSVRRGARSLAVPRLGSGRATIEVTADGGPTPFRTTIDTSAVGFRSRPIYTVTAAADSAVVRELKRGAAGPFVSVADPTEAGFAVDVLLYGTAADFELQLAWVGVEPPPGCPSLRKAIAMEVH